MYNRTIETINEQKEYNRIRLRNKLSLNHQNTERPWLLETPKAVRDCAVFEAHKNMNTSFTLLKNKTINHFNLNFKKRHVQWTFNLPKSGIKIKNNNLELFSRIFGKELKTFKHHESLPLIEHDCKIQYDGINYFLIIPMSIKNQDIHKEQSICSLDPGIRTFQTGYSPDGYGFKLGDGASTRIFRLYLHLDKLISALSKIHGKKRRYLKKRILRLRIKIKNLINEMHHKISLFLSSNFRTILLPSFETKIMSNRLMRKIHTKTVRKMIGLSFYRFSEILKYKCKLRGSKVLTVSEAYTSKTCGNCGELHNKLGGNKIYKCSNCNLEIDRDLNGARNIMLRALGDAPSS